MGDNEIGFAIIGFAIAVMVVFATLQFRAWGPYLLTLAITAVVLRFAAWTFSWWVVAACWVPLVIFLVIPVRKEKPRRKGHRYYLYRGGNTAHRIRFDDEDEH